MAHNTAFSTNTASQVDRDHEKFVVLALCKGQPSHQLRYDSQLVAFISTVEGTIQAKQDEICRHIHSLTDVASLSHKACLTLALQILDKLPAIPLKLSYHTAICMLLGYYQESYAFQT